MTLPIIDLDARSVLQLIADGYHAKGFDGRYILLEDPSHTGKFMVFDVDTLYPVPPEETTEDAA